MSETGEEVVLRGVEIADLRAILGELEQFWDGRDAGFLHQALYVHEFGETSVLAELNGGRAYVGAAPGAGSPTSCTG